MLLFLIYYAQEKTCALFCTTFWPDYHITIFYKDCFKIFPIMLALYLMLSETYYAQNYAGIIGLGLLALIYSFFINYAQDLLKVKLWLVTSYHTHYIPLLHIHISYK